MQNKTSMSERVCLSRPRRKENKAKLQILKSESNMQKFYINENQKQVVYN